MTRLEYIKTLDLEKFVQYVYVHKEFNFGYKRLKNWLNEKIPSDELIK